MIAIPPTRNHRQLAAWVNSKRLFDRFGNRVCAKVSAGRVSTDRKLAGTRLRRAGRGRASLRLEIWIDGGSLLDPAAKLFEHESGETYRRHGEARAWIAQNLHRARLRRR